MDLDLRKFEFTNLDDLNTELEKHGIHAANDIVDLTSPIMLNDFKLVNRLVALPMEGVDGKDGRPTDLTKKKYIDVAKGGYGLIWLEATSVNKEGMSNDNQLFINDDTVNDFQNLNTEIKEASKESAYGGEAYTVLQLNHSGRYANIGKDENAQIATHREKLDAKRGLEKDRELVSDSYLDGLKNDYLKAARLAKKAGFDAVDIKACHGYLLSELLSATDREGTYGGSFENRTRFLLETIDLIRKDEKCEGLDIAVRLNMADMTDHGFATTTDLDYDLTETIKLIERLQSSGVKLISLTLGNPYFISYISKPSDLKKDETIESPFTSSFRIFEMCGKLQKLFPEMIFVGVGYTFFREFGANVAEGLIRDGKISLAGFGRDMLAYPELGNDLLKNGKMDKNKVCITCNLCSKLKANFLPAGCVVRNRQTYGKYVKELNK